MKLEFIKSLYKIGYPKKDKNKQRKSLYNTFLVKAFKRHIRQELITQITLEHKFRTDINTLIDYEIVDNKITIDEEIIDLNEIVNFLDTY